jgi:hypothetical protein
VRAKIFQPGITLLALVLLATGFEGCNRSQQSSNQGAAQARPTPPRTDFEQKLQYVRDGQFTYMYVFSRPDNAALDKDDVVYLKENAPRETNMWVKTDDGRRVIAGTNFEFTPENLDALRKRFNVEDYSGR